MTSLTNTSNVKIAHAALWTTDIERLCSFWARLFGVSVGDLYVSKNRQGFKSRFMKFKEGPTIEVMTGPWVTEQAPHEAIGYAHLAISVGSKEEVDRLATTMKAEAALVSGPRLTGDGYYEAVIRDPDGNLIEITS